MRWYPGNDKIQYLLVQLQDLVRLGWKIRFYPGTGIQIPVWDIAICRLAESLYVTHRADRSPVTSSKIMVSLTFTRQLP